MLRVPCRQALCRRLPARRRRGGRLLHVAATNPGRAGCPRPVEAAPIGLTITRIGAEQAKIRVALISLALPQADQTDEDWRTLVDAIAIDPAYDGQVLRVAVADAPLKRSQLVQGVYEFPAPPAPTIVAVRITDVWGQEHLVVADLSD